MSNKSQLSYWNRCGKYQGKAEELSKNMCSSGYTTNIYMDAFIAMSRIYFDAHKNQFACKYERSASTLENYIRPVMGSSFGSMDKFYSDLDYLENMLDEVILFVSKQDISYTTRIAYINDATRTYSLTRYFSGGYKYTFGDIETLLHRIDGYTLVE